MDLIGATAFGMNFNCLTNPKADFRKQGDIIFANSHMRHLNFLLVFFMPQFLKPLGIEFFPKPSSKFFMQVFSEVLNEKRKGAGDKIDFLDYVAEFKNQKVLLNKETQGTSSFKICVLTNIIFFSILTFS